MRTVKIFFYGVFAGVLEEHEPRTRYVFHYDNAYNGEPISLTFPSDKKEIEFDSFPPFFDGLLPEGLMLESLLRQKKIDKNDGFSQLVVVGKDLVGAVTVEEDE